MISTLTNLLHHSAARIHDQLKQLRETDHPITVEERVLALELLNLHVLIAQFCELNNLTCHLSATELDNVLYICSQMHVKLLDSE